MGKKLHNFLSKRIYIEKFIEFNRQRIEPANLSEKIALFEITMNFAAFIGYSNFAKLLATKGIDLVGYKPIHDVSLIDRVKFLFLRKWSFDSGTSWPFRILKSMGISTFLLPPILISRNLFAILKMFSKFKTLSKSEILFFECENIRIGDLFYDWHLRHRGLETIQLNSKFMKLDFFKFMNTFLFWNKYFKTNNVEVVLVSHAVYAQGMVARIGVKSGSKVFLVGADRIYRLTKNRPFPDSEFLQYDPGNLNQFGYQIDYSRSKNAIEMLKIGSQKIDTAHAYVSGFKGAAKKKIVKDPNKVNVLIASHCFSDAPHAYGDQLFPDFYEWLNFLGRISSESDFDWYIKAHPGFFDSDLLHFESLLSKFPSLIGIDSNYSNLELFKQGINVVLTVHGTIAFEAAYENILVINASQVAPHINYGFSSCPSSIEELIRMIDDIPNMMKKLSIERNEILHFYDVHHLRKLSNVYFGELYGDLLEYIGGYSNLFISELVFNFWIENIYMLSTESKILKDYDSFFLGDEYFLVLKNFRN
jgi:hypothetical protein